MNNNQPPARVRSRQERLRENDPVTATEFTRARDLATARARRAREIRDQMAEDPEAFANLADDDGGRNEIRPRGIVPPVPIPPQRAQARLVQPREPSPPRVEVGRLEERVAHLEREIDKSIRHKRPYYDVPSTRTRDLRRMLENPDLPPKVRENVLGMLEANRRFRWWNIRHPPI